MQECVYNNGDANEHSLHTVYILTQAVSTEKNSLIPPRSVKAAEIRHNELYSVKCVRIACRSENITVLGSPQVFDEWILLQFFYTMHSISVLYQEAKG